MSRLMPINVVCWTVLAFGFLFGQCLSCHAQSVQITLGNEAGGYGYEPLEALSSAIEHHVIERFVRVTWYDIVGSLSATVTILYDRHSETIKYYCCGGHNAGGNTADIVYAHYLYTGATETLICHAADYEKDRDWGKKSSYGKGPYPDAIQKATTYSNAGPTGSYYDSLLTFGCHRRKLP